MRRNRRPDLVPVVTTGDAGGPCAAMRAAAAQRRSAAFMYAGIAQTCAN